MRRRGRLWSWLRPASCRFRGKTNHGLADHNRVWTSLFELAKPLSAHPYLLTFRSSPKSFPPRSALHFLLCELLDYLKDDNQCRVRCRLVSSIGNLSQENSGLDVRRSNPYRLLLKLSRNQPTISHEKYDYVRDVLDSISMESGSPHAHKNGSILDRLSPSSSSRCERERYRDTGAFHLDLSRHDKQSQVDRSSIVMHGQWILSRNHNNENSFCYMPPFWSFDPDPFIHWRDHRNSFLELIQFPLCWEADSRYELHIRYSTISWNCRRFRILHQANLQVKLWVSLHCRFARTHFTDYHLSITTTSWFAIGPSQDVNFSPNCHSHFNIRILSKSNRKHHAHNQFSRGT
jgi:hypothetical protein